MTKLRTIWILTLLFLSGCTQSSAPEKPRLVMFIGADISGSFLKGKYFEDSLDFLAHYIYSHLNGLGGLEKPHALFVGSIGGEKPNEPKTLYPIQTFENASVKEIRKRLASIFPKHQSNPFTDYNAFFEQVANTVKSRKLILKPISIVMISDGKPDVPKAKGNEKFRHIKLNPLEALSRNITVRLLYTDAVIGAGWQNEVPRRRVKVWTTDGEVMVHWKAKGTLIPGKALGKQDRFFRWVKDNVNFGVRAKRVN